MRSLSRGSRLSRGSLRGTGHGTGTDTGALRGTGLPPHQPHKCLRQRPGPGVSAEPQRQPRSPQGEEEDRPHPSPQERAEGRASALRMGPAAAHNKPDRQTRDTHADIQRHTETHTTAAAALSHQGLRHPGPGPARARPQRRLRTSRAFPDGRARTGGGRQRPGHAPPVPSHWSRARQGSSFRRARLLRLRRSSCCCSRSPRPPFCEGTGGACFPIFYFARGKLQFKSSGLETLQSIPCHHGALQFFL